ncbi:hypothetical protein NMY22_g8204 [Coprinellus aureogranulatus]|nr:hypothetical protein NMY22_g8204 [Coprinellus aureogranulatus]
MQIQCSVSGKEPEVSSALRDPEGSALDFLRSQMETNALLGAFHCLIDPDGFSEQTRTLMEVFSNRAGSLDEEYLMQTFEYWREGVMGATTSSPDSDGITKDDSRLGSRPWDELHGWRESGACRLTFNFRLGTPHGELGERAEEPDGRTINGNDRDSSPEENFEPWEQLERGLQRKDKEII